MLLGWDRGKWVFPILGVSSNLFNRYRLSRKKTGQRGCLIVSSESFCEIIYLDLGISVYTKIIFNDIVHLWLLCRLTSRAEECPYSPQIQLAWFPRKPKQSCLSYFVSVAKYSGIISVSGRPPGHVSMVASRIRHLCWMNQGFLNVLSMRGR